MRETTVTKLLTEGLLDDGEVRLTEREADLLGLPRRADQIECRHDDQVFLAEWRGRELTLSGELLSEELVMTGQVGGLLRLQRAGAGIELAFVAPSRSTLPAGAATPAPVAVAQGGGRSPSDQERTRRSRSRSRAREARARVKGDEEYLWYGSVGVHQPTVERFTENVTACRWDDKDVFELRLRGERLAAVNDFDELLAVDLAKVDHMPHQEQTAMQALGPMRGRAILADEVGLGKTVEAGFIMKELIVRGLARRALVLCPATLRDQWRDELHDKFDETFDIVLSGRTSFPGDRVIMSHHLARRYAEALAAEDWDLVIVDEAHKLSGANAKKSRALLEGLDTRYKLFLTATPVQGDLLELYRLVEMLRPGTFRSPREFRRRYVSPDNKRIPRDPQALRRLVREVMLRTTREQAGLDKVARHAVDVPVKLSKVERQAYEICTDLLRHVMVGPHDHLRRRVLAQRLTTSPRALAVTAAKMAEAGRDPKAVAILRDLADLCADFGVTNRQKALLRQVERWTGDRVEHGKVLVFAQAYETIGDLHRLLAANGVEAVSYHGGLTPKARQQAIGRFRSGDCSVMLSTDAGAEGLNLQFANSVVNYDLPWNPMRIEQRIGRVHRVTQHRDVHVANFFARDTVDERVYEVLHDKLRMFELLFGQVTTILGEIGEGEHEAGFEAEVLDAYLARDDKEMSRKLARLGARVDKAYQAAQRISTTSSREDYWLADLSHRDTITEQARELLPYVEVPGRRRQRDVYDFVEEWLEAVGATIDESSPDGSFLMASLPDEVADDMGGQRHLCLAFSLEGLDHHRHAELCAVGSEAFDDLVYALRDRGDLLIEALQAPDLVAEPVPKSVPGTELVAREVRGPADWAGQAQWRVSAGESSLSAEIVTAEMGEVDGFLTPRHQVLPPGEELPETAGTPDEVVEWVVDSSLPRLQHLKERLQAEADRAAADERTRLISSYDERIAEAEEGGPGRRPGAGAEDIGKLRRARDQVKQRQAADVELRAEMLSVRLVGGETVRVVETWRGPSGALGVLETGWDATAGRHDVVGDDGKPVDVVQVCHEGHAVDQASTRQCETCERAHCAACAPGLARRRCPACKVWACGRCRDTAGLCRHCSDPLRARHLDRDGLVAWTIGRGRTVLVGEGLAYVDGKLHDGRIGAVPIDLLTRVRAEARRRAVRPDAGARSLGGPVPAGALPGGAFAVQECGRDMRWVVDPSGGSQVERPAASELPIAGDDGALPESVSPLRTVLAQLRLRVPPEPAPQLLLDTVTTTGWLQCIDGRLHAVTRVTSAYEPKPREEAVPVEWTAPDHAEAEAGVVAVAGTALGRLVLRRLHRAYTLDVEGGGSWFVPGDDGGDAVTEQVAAALARRVGLAPGTVVGVVPAPPRPTRVAAPVGGTCSSFRITEQWHRVDAAASPFALGDLPEDLVDVILADADSAQGPPCEDVPAPAAGPVRDAVGGVVAGLAAGGNDRAPVALEPVAEVSATWELPWLPEGRRTVARRFTPAPGELARPPLDDTGEPADEFTVDDHGHLCEPAHVWDCPACATRRCRACGDAGALGACTSCGQQACGACRDGGHGRRPAHATCDRCGVTSCGACGRDARAARCPVCRRTACASCRRGATCVTCASLAPASADEVAALPADLVAHGLDVRVARDDSLTVVALVGAARVELALLEGDTIREWWALDDADEHERKLRLAVGRRIGTGDTRVAHDGVIHAPVPDADGIRARRVETATATWRAVDRHDRTVLDRSSEATPVPTTNRDAIMGALAAEDVMATTPVPSEPATPDHAEALGAALGKRRVPAAVVVHVRAVVVIDEAYLREDGLVHRYGTAGALREDAHPWLKGPGQLAAEVDAWPVQPSASLHAEMGDVAVTIARVGPVVALGICKEGAATWRRIDDRHDDPLASLLMAIRLGRPVACSVNRMTSREEVVPFTVANGVLRRRALEPIARESVAPAGPDMTAEAVRSWASRPGSTLRVFTDMEHVALPQAKMLASRVPSGSKRVELGVTVEETWDVAAGPITVTYEVRAGERLGRVPAFDTGMLHGQLAADRSGHLVEASSTCAYCRTLTCVHCTGAVQPCWLCGIAVCGVCGPGDGAGRTCPACASLAPLGWRERRRAGRELKGAVLRGGDGRRGVVVAPRPGGGALVLSRVEGAPPTVLERPLDQIRRTRLNALVGSPAFHATVTGGATGGHGDAGH